MRIKSKLLTEFWGTPVYLGASALLPRDYDKHPDVRYPTIYAQSQDATAPFYFNPDPASQEQELGLKEGNVQTGYEFYQSWIADGFPRFVVIVMEQSSPYFLEAYSVDSANNGPYGQAITQELIPYLEKTFRLVPKPYARIVEGASTGGWESLALQLKYPDFFGGAWVFNPDPIDFHHYLLTNIYEDENAFSVQMSRFMSIERPFRRSVEGQVTHTMRDIARLEAVMGSKGRSGYQLDGWHSVHGPVGPDGYPVPLFDKRTGVIDKSVVEYMREQRLRPDRVHAPQLADARAEAGRQAQLLRRRDGQLPSQPRRLRLRSNARADQQPALSGPLRVRSAEEGPQLAPDRLLANDPRDGRARQEERPGRGEHDAVELLRMSG